MKKIENKKSSSRPPIVLSPIKLLLSGVAGQIWAKLTSCSTFETIFSIRKDSKYFADTNFCKFSTLAKIGIREN